MSDLEPGAATMADGTPIIAPLPAILYPPWMDGPWMLRAAEWERSEKTMHPLTNTLLVAGSPRRFALGVKILSAVAATAQISPATPSALGGWQISSIADPVWFTLFTFGPMVCAPWYFTGNDGVACEIWECLLH